MNTNLKVSNITKIYPGCIANDDISLEFKSGKIYATANSTELVVEFSPK